MGNSPLKKNKQINKKTPNNKQTKPPTEQYYIIHGANYGIEE